MIQSAIKILCTQEPSSLPNPIKEQVLVIVNRIVWIEVQEKVDK